MLLKDFIAGLSSSLSRIYPTGEAKAAVLRLCEEKLGVKPYTHIIEPLTEIPEESIAELTSLAQCLSSGEPLQYVLGYADFCSHRFYVNHSVLIPRPETEQLCSYINWSVQQMKPGYKGEGLRILDLCTGSGCIAWTLAAYFPQAEVTGVDISKDALSIAGSQQLHLPDGSDVPAPTFVCADILSPAFTLDGKFDIVISNPPYVRESEKCLMRPNVLEHEPSIALFVEDSDPLLFYRAIASIFQRFGAEDAFGCVEINEALGGPTAEEFNRTACRDVSVMKDFNDKDRFILFKK